MAGKSPTRYLNRIRQLRQEKGLKQRELARIMGYGSVSSLSHMEAGRKLPSIKTVMKLEAALQRPIRDIYPRLFDEVYEPVGRRRVELYKKRRIGGW